MNMVVPNRPVLRWHGGKWVMAPWVISHFPSHQLYAEPFGGAASVLMRKPRARAEIYNDLDETVVNLFRVLRDPLSAGELTRRLRFTPYARAEFEWSYGEPVDAIDKAHRTIVRSFMGFGSDSVTRSCRTGFRAALTGSADAFPSREWADWPDCVALFTARLAGVLIECRPALEIIDRADAPETLFYLDPPYLLGTRTAMADGRAAVHGYVHEMTDADHAALLDRALRIEGMVVLSGYPSALYDEALAGWQRVERIAMADGAKPRTEVLWLNPACAARLGAEGRGARVQLDMLEVLA